MTQWEWLTAFAAGLLSEAALMLPLVLFPDVLVRPLLALDLVWHGR